MITTTLMFIGLLFVAGLAVYGYYTYVTKKYNTVELGDINHFICDSCGEKISVDKFDGKCHNCGSESFTIYF